MKNVSAINIETGQAQDSVKKLKQDINRLRDEILNLEKGTEEYDKAVKVLQDNQRRYNEVMALTKKEATALEGSYDALVHKMSLLKKEWRATNDEARRTELGFEIETINSQLKEFDSSIGNYQRNVGNYFGDVSDALTEFQMDLEGTTERIKPLKNEIRDAKNALLDAEEGTEEYTDAMTRLADAQFQLRDINEQSRYAVADFGEQLSNVVGITQGVVAGFSAFQSVMVLAGADTEDFEKIMIKVQASMALVQGLQGLEGLIDRVKGFTTAMKVMSKTMGTAGWLGLIALVGTAILGLNKLLQKQREEVNVTKTAINEFNTALKETTFGTEELASLQAYNEIATDVNDSMEDRIKASERLLTILKLEITEENTQKALLGQLNEEIEDYTENIKQQTIAKVALSQIEGIVSKQMQLQMEILELENEKVTTQGGFWDRFWYGSKGRDKTIQKIDEDIKNKKKEIEDLNAQITAVTNSAQQLGADFITDKEDEKEDEDTTTTTTTSTSTTTSTTSPLKLFDVGAIKENLAEYNQAIKDEEIKAINQNIEEIVNTYDIAIREKLINGENPFDLQIEKIKSQIEAINELILNTDDADEKAKLMWEKANLELDILEQTNNEKERLREEDEKNEKEHQAKLYNISMASMGALSDLFGTMADIYESDEKNAEKYAEQIKAFRITSAIIDTIQGAITAFSSAMQLGPIAGPIVGAINAGAVTAMGIANIAKIRNTKVGDKSANIDNNINSSQVTPRTDYTQSNPFEYTRNVTGVSEYEELNKSQRVYILESDLQESNRKVQIRQNETSF